MTTLRAAVVGSFLLFSLAGGVARAGHADNHFPTGRECRASEAFVCTRQADGSWMAQYIEPSPRFSGIYGGAVGFALLWSGLPALIGGLVASRRRQNVRLAVLLGILLSWLGLLSLLIAMFGLSPDRLEQSRLSSRSREGGAALGT